jgi:hypothetical protein
LPYGVSHSLPLDKPHLRELRDTRQSMTNKLSGRKACFVHIFSNQKGEITMKDTKNGTKEVWVLIADLEGNPSAEIVGVYETKDACRKDFKDILDSLWPNDMIVDDNGNDKAGCLEDLLFCNDRYRDYLEAQSHDVKR